MRNITLTALLVLATALPAAGPARAAAAGQAWYSQQFAADLVQPNPAKPGEKMVSKLYVGSAALRLEPPFPRPLVIYDARRKVTWILVPARKEYREEKGASPTIADLLPKPGGDPCQAGFLPPKTRCRKIGSETVNGRATEHWEITWEVSGRRLVFHQWVDRRLWIIVRYVTPEGTTYDVTNFRMGAQPAHLFGIPKDYRRAK
jgi:hypothetical protein